jgi:hypothetical protein
MRAPLMERIKAWICDRFGHRPVVNEYDVTCKRCRRLLAGPLQMDAWRGESL